MTNDFNALFAEAQAAFARHQYDECHRRLDFLFAQLGSHPALSHLRALCLAQGGKSDDALTAFEEAVQLSGASPDPALLANFARLRWERLEHSAALPLLERAAELAPQDPAIQNMRINAIWGVLGKDAADAAFANLLASQPEAAALWHYKALFMCASGRHSDALDAIRIAIRLAPNSANARHLEARLMLDLGLDARDLFDAFCEAYPDNEDAVCGYAAACFQAGEVDRALVILDEAIARHPKFAGAITTRLRISSQSQSTEDAAQWIATQAAARPLDAELARQRSHFLWRSQGPAAALEAAPTEGEEGALVHYVEHAELLSDNGAFAEATAMFATREAEIVRAPAQLRMAVARHFFRAGDAEQATKIALEIAENSHLIEAWAYVEAGWRMTGDPRWNWLMRGGDLIRSFQLKDFAYYQEELVHDLHRLHSAMQNQPFEQSVRGGTQTDGFILARREAAIQALRRDLEACVAQYIAGIEGIDRSHPLARLSGAAFQIVGSWSVRLRSAGNHAAHFHNEGLLSSACYIALPQSMCAGDAVASRDGWIEFGRPPDRSGIALDPFAEVEPNEGKLVLFPSYLFHGTRPFASGERLTVAFDISDVRL